MTRRCRSVKDGWDWGGEGIPGRGVVVADFAGLAFTRKRLSSSAAEPVSGQVVFAVFGKAKNVLTLSGCGFWNLLHRQWRTSN